jgi:hypothetical protein
MHTRSAVRDSEKVCAESFAEEEPADPSVAWTAAGAGGSPQLPRRGHA